MTKKLLAILLCFVMVFSLAACGGGGESEEEGYDVLKIGMMPFGIGVPAYYAMEQGYFDELGLNVEFFMFANGAGINEALAAQEVDLGVSGLAMIFSLASGTCTMLADGQVSSAMGVYVRPDSPILADSQEVDGQTIYGSAETVKSKKSPVPPITAATTV